MNIRLVMALIVSMTVSGCTTGNRIPVPEGYSVVQTKDISVHSELGWQGSGIDIKDGDFVQITASGYWRGNIYGSGPEGSNFMDLVQWIIPPLQIVHITKPMKLTTFWSLIAESGNGREISIGRRCAIDNRAGSYSGPLAFRINSAFLMGNSGAMKVVAETYRRSAIASVDADGYEGRGTRGTTGNHHALIIGVSQYQDSRIPSLRYADDDAGAFASALRKQGWKASQIEQLTDKQATAEVIENAIRYGPDLDDSLLVLYWAGHGFPDPVDARKLFLACHDTKIDSPASGIRMADIRSWLEERKARNVVIIADACHSGGLVSGRSLAPRALPRPEDVPPGWMYLLSSSISEKAVEHPSLQGGLFTTSLVEALNGAAEGYGKLGRRDGSVTMAEIEEYVRDEVQAKASKFNLQGSFKIQAVTDTADKDIWELTLQGNQ